MSKKVVSIDGGKKDQCQFCGATPECPMMTCPRLSGIEFFSDGKLAAATFFAPDDWQTVPQDAEK